MKPKIWLSSPHMGGKELTYIQEAFSANWIAPVGPNIELFEQRLQNYLGHGFHSVVFCGLTGILKFGFFIRILVNISY